MSNLGNRYATSWYLYESVKPEIEINDIYTINDSLKIISTPGHSEGSRITSYNVCYTKLLRILLQEEQVVEM